MPTPSLNPKRIAQARPRSTLFTGSQRVAEQLTADLHGKARACTIGFRVVRTVHIGFYEPFHKSAMVEYWGDCLKTYTSVRACCLDVAALWLVGGCIFAACSHHATPACKASSLHKLCGARRRGPHASFKRRTRVAAS